MAEKRQEKRIASACVRVGESSLLQGARQIGTLVHELHRTNKKYGLVSMCIGTGMGAAAIFERPQEAGLKARL